ncbi:MAG: anti-sigma factor [Actinomycetota bacterium]
MTRFDDWANHLDPDGPGADLIGGEMDGLDRIADALADEALWGDPPASLRGRLLAQAQAEAEAAADPDATAGLGAAGAPPPQHRAQTDLDAEFDLGSIDGLDAGPADPGSGSILEIADASTPARTKARSRWFGRAVSGAAAAVIAVIATIGVTGYLDASDDGDITTFAAAGTELAPDAQADVDVEPLGAGVAITLNITGLPPAGEGEYYAGWLTGDEGQVPIGSFHWREGGIPIELWSGVDIERYPRLGITLQREGEPTTSNGELVLTADLGGTPISD